MPCGRKLGIFDCCSVVEGDCLELMKQLPDGCVDAVITDPPYGKKFHDGGQRGISPTLYRGVTIANDGEAPVECVDELYRVTKYGGAAYLFSQWMVDGEWSEAVRATGFLLRNRIAWIKPNFGAGDLETTFAQQHETILFCAKGHHELRDGRSSDVWVERGSAFQRNEFHPTEKPIPLVEFLLSKSTEDGGTILDPFLGSGTTAVAAKKLGRHFLGFEISPEYCRIARARIALVEAQPSLFEPKPEQMEMPR